MQNLTKASQELFKRQPDECFESLTALWEHCRRQKEACVDRWVPPRSIQTNPVDAGRLTLAAGDDGAFAMNDWSFGQLCRLAGVAKEITEVVIHLPAGYTIVYIPRAVILDSPVGSLHLSLIQEGGKVVYKKTFTVKKSVVTPEEYADFRKLITAQRVRRNTVILLQRTEG